MKKWRKSLAGKLLAALLAIVLAFGCGFGVVASAALLDDYYEDSYLESGAYRSLLNDYQSMAMELYDLSRRENLSAEEQERQKELQDILNHTNFAFTIYVNDEAVFTNRGETDWNDADSVGRLCADFPLYAAYGHGWEEYKTVPVTTTDEPDESTEKNREYGSYDILVSKDDRGNLSVVEYWSALKELAADGMLFGVKNEDTSVMYSISYEEAVELVEMLQLRELLGEPEETNVVEEVIATYYRIEYGTLSGLQVADAFTYQKAEYDGIRSYIPVVTGCTIIAAVLLLAALIWLMVAAGWHKDEEAVSLRGTEKLPADASLVVWGGAAALALLLATQIFYQTPALRRGITEVFCFFVGGCAALGVALTIPLLDTIVAQLKCRSLIGRSLCAKLIRWCGRKIKGFFRWLLADGRLAVWLRTHLQELGCLIKKHVSTALIVCGVFILYVILVLAAGRMTLGWTAFWLLFNLCVMLAAEFWLLKFQDVREGARMIAEGQVEHKVNTEKMPPDLKEIADSLNNLSEGVNKAVEERMKSERFRAELITNVSHDLKTPLTSIINYIDLLKKTSVEDPEAAEYIEVLDRKSQQLKKLTEDLVEASKASTGSMPTRLEVLNLSQLVNQALGEYDERLLAKRLHVVVNQPDELMVQADGKHLWRVLDNLLSNCVKYAMPGTRVYLTSTVKDLFAEITVKNISEAPLNLTEEELMERFVQGDSSRSAEGSGLGLSIARSLMSLQHGSFAISVDGDLFKAAFTVPLAEME